jgi:lipoic acid synthetase
VVTCAPGAATSATSRRAARPPSTSTSRDAAGLYAETIRQIHLLNPNTGVEILPPDFGAKPELVGQVFDARPEVFAHNLETVPRIFRRIRPAFTYEKSLAVLSMAREAELVTKSNLILGMGETDTEIEEAIRDLHDAGCDILTITQYLRPSKLHHPIDRWVKPEEFVHWSEVAEEMGFKGVMAGPLVRSSYRAGRLWATAMRKWGREIPAHLSHLAEAAESPARQEAASLVARAQSAVS